MAKKFRAQSRVPLEFCRRNSKTFPDRVLGEQPGCNHIACVAKTRSGGGELLGLWWRLVEELLLKDIHPAYSHVVPKVSLLPLRSNERNAYIRDQVKTSRSRLDAQL